MSAQFAAADPTVVSIPQFEGNTRLKRIRMAGQSKTTDGQLMSFQLPRTGFLRGIALAIRMTVAGSLSAPNAAGFSSIVKQVRLVQNGGIAIIDLSGPGYHYGLREYMELGQDTGSYTTGRTAVTATTTTLDMYLPVAPNLRDPVGLLNLQTEQNTYTLTVQFELDANVAAGATVTGTVTPMLEIFTVPPDPAMYPPDDVVHRILEESITYTGATQQTYYPLRGDIYLQLFHLIGGDAVAATDKFSDAQLRFNQSDYVQDALAAHLDILRAREGLTARRAGLVVYDFLASAGLGNYDRLRDVVDSHRVTDFASLWTQNATPVTVRTIRRMLTRIG